MAARRKQREARKVAATPHPPRSRRTKHSCLIDSESSDTILDGMRLSSPALNSYRRKTDSNSKRRHQVSPSQANGLNTGISGDSPLTQPRAKRRRTTASASGGANTDDYAVRLKAAGFCSPPLADREPAVQLHNNRPNAPTHPPEARLRPLTVSEARQLTTDDPPVRVYADGVFDLFHFGHAELLRQAKQSFSNVCLVTGIPSDDVVKELKGNTVLTAAERLLMMRHNRYVDEVIEDAPFTPTLEFLDRHKIDFVAHDEKPLPVPGKPDIYMEVKEAGRFVGTQRTRGISTSDLIARIVRNYDTYVRRNLSRGYPREGMGLSYVNEKSIQARGHMTDMMHTWKSSRRSLIGGFLGMFGPLTGPISSIFKGHGPQPIERNPTASGGSGSGRGRRQQHCSPPPSFSASRFDDFLDDATDEQEDDDLSKPWFRESSEFLLSESDSGGEDFELGDNGIGNGGGDVKQAIANQQFRQGHRQPRKLNG